MSLPSRERGSKLRQVRLRSRGRRRSLHGSVDRNFYGPPIPILLAKSLPSHGSVDRNDLLFAVAASSLGSLPSRERGSKPLQRLTRDCHHKVAPLDRNAGDGCCHYGTTVAPFTGAWIETRRSVTPWPASTVAPFTGASRERGSKQVGNVFLYGLALSLPSRKRESKPARWAAPPFSVRRSPSREGGRIRAC
jgi:hypothetical protein